MVSHQIVFLRGSNFRHPDSQDRGKDWSSNGNPVSKFDRPGPTEGPIPSSTRVSKVVPPNNVEVSNSDDHCQLGYF